MFRKENAKTASFTPREDKKLYEAIADFKARCGKFTQLDWNRIRDISDVIAWEYRLAWDKWSEY